MLNLIHYLSYELSESLSGYGGAKAFEHKKTRSMCCGDTSNNSEVNFSVHFGTHIDVPFHFSEKGKTLSDYHIENFFFNSIVLFHLDLRNIQEMIITPEKLNLVPNQKTEVLVIKTGFCEFRNLERYWSDGPGFHPDCAAHLKKIYPSLKIIGFDSISLTNFQHRELGREAHKKFLIENDLLIVEDMDLSLLNSKTIIREIAFIPLRIKNADGAPVTVLANLDFFNGQN